MIFLIYANSYNENSGGSIVLHRLCHLINSVTDNEAYIVRMDPFSHGSISLRKIYSKFKWELATKKRFKTHQDWHTPIWTKKKFPDDAIVIYPEIVNGNPLGINNVVRWLLHQPGFHTNKVKYCSGELYYKFNSAIEDFENLGSKTSNLELKVIYYPIDIYNNKDNVKYRDIDCSYLIRKGIDKKIIHDLDAVKIDGLSHKEIAHIFKRSNKFISYDDYTAYSIFATLCGCKSYVVPSENKSLESWYPNENDRYGISYGFSTEQEIWANDTKDKVMMHIENEHIKSSENVKLCIKEMIDYFSS